MTAKARVLRHSGRRQAPEKECPDWRDWRRVAHWPQTFFSLEFAERPVGAQPHRRGCRATSGESLNHDPGQNGNEVPSD
jgi:hypothetical protein